MEKTFKKLVSSLTSESDLVTLSAKLIAAGCWEAVSDFVLDRCSEIGGDDMEDRVYNSAWAISNCK